MLPRAACHALANAHPLLPPPSGGQCPSPTSWVSCNCLPAQRDLADDIVMPVEKRAGEGSSQGPCPTHGEVGTGMKGWVGGWVICLCLPSGAQAWVPSTHTPPYPRPARRRPDGGNPAVSAQCTPPPRRGSDCARRLLSCKGGHRGLETLGPHRWQTPGDPDTYTHTLPWGYSLKQRHSHIYHGSQRHRHIHAYADTHMQPQKSLEIHIYMSLHTNTCRHAQRKHSHRCTDKKMPRHTQRPTDTHSYALVHSRHTHRIT